MNISMMMWIDYAMTSPSSGEGKTAAVTMFVGEGRYL